MDPYDPTTPQTGPPVEPRKEHHWYRPRNVMLGAGALVVALVAIGVAGGGSDTPKVQPVTAPSSQAAPPQTVTFTDPNGVTCTVPTSPVTAYCPGGEPSETPSGPDMLTMGGTETVGSNDTGATEGTITVGSLVRATQPADSYGSAPKNGYFVIVTARAAADTGYTDGFDVSSSDFYALSGGSHYDEANGNSYDALSDSSDELGYTTLAAGERVSGKMVFDVPSRHGKIVYAPNYDGQPLAEWSY